MDTFGWSVYFAWVSAELWVTKPLVLTKERFPAVAEKTLQWQQGSRSAAEEMRGRGAIAADLGRATRNP